MGEGLGSRIEGAGDNDEDDVNSKEGMQAAPSTELGA